MEQKPFVIYQITRKDEKGLQGKLDFTDGVRGIVQGLKEEQYNVEVDSYQVNGYILVSPPITEEHQRIIQSAYYNLVEVSVQEFQDMREARDEKFTKGVAIMRAWFRGPNFDLSRLSK